MINRTSIALGILSLLIGSAATFLTLYPRIIELLAALEFANKRIETARGQLHEMGQSFASRPRTTPIEKEEPDWQILSQEGFALIIPGDWEISDHNVYPADNKRYSISYFVGEVEKMAENDPEGQRLLKEGKAYEYERRRSLAICEENGEGRCGESKVVYVKEIEVNGTKGVEYSVSGPGLRIDEPRGTTVSVQQLFIKDGKLYRFYADRSIAPADAPDLQERYPALNPDELDVFHDVMSGLRIK